MRRTLQFSYLLFFSVIILSTCTDPLPDDQIPLVLVDETINLNNYQYQALGFVGGYAYLNGGGVRGIIIYRSSLNEYLAFERNCTFQPMDPCADVRVDKSGLFLIDSCCSSTFDFNGFPTGGPASLPLRQYDTFLNDNYLTITNGM